MSLDDFLDKGPRSDASPPVPAIAAKVEDLEAFRKSVEDSAAASGGLWLSYIFVLFYLGVAAGAVTHTDLLLQNPVKLPFLNIELPLLAFFFLAPILFVITHAYTLVNLALLADRVRQFHRKLSDQLAADPGLQPKGLEIRSVLTGQLPSNIFVQFLGGPDEIRKHTLGKALAVILWLTLVVAPIALLLLLQIQFLPYHSRWVTWINRGFFVLDLGLIWGLWGNILRRGVDHSTANRGFFVLDLGLIWWLWGNILRRGVDHSTARFWRPSVQTSIAVLLSVCTILFAYAIATIPGEWQENHLPFQTALAFVRGWIFAGKLDDTTRLRRSLFSNTLVLPGLNIYEALKIDDPKKVEWKQYLVDLRGRNLEGAVLSGAVLPRADLTGAHLEGAALDLAELEGATLNSAHLQGASLSNAFLRGAWLDFTQLQGASLDGASLEGANSAGVRLQGASLKRAQLQGTNLIEAQLHGASFAGAVLQGASLSGAQLQGANLADAYLWRANLKGSGVENIFASDGKVHWSPIGNEAPPTPWTDATYAALRQYIKREVPQGFNREAALERVAILDCEKKDGDTLASCDPSAALPDAVQQWKRMVEAASVDKGAYARALASILDDLVCTVEANLWAKIGKTTNLMDKVNLVDKADLADQVDRADLIYVLRGLLQNGRFRDIGPEMPALAKRITSAECPVSTELTDADKRNIAEAVEKSAKSP
jgi:uncharacterized protein YjbI with pentapeptide repeats